MSAHESQVVNPQEFIDILDYEFTGNDATVGNKRCFIEQLRKRAAVYVAADAAGINKVTAYRWRDSDPAFAKAWDEALEDAADVMVSSIYERALGLNGNKPDNLLAMFWTKAHRPQFRDKVTIDITGLQDEINQRMEQLGLRELPPMLATTLDDSGNGNHHEPQSQQILDQHASKQKED